MITTNTAKKIANEWYSVKNIHSLVFNPDTIWKIENTMLCWDNTFAENEKTRLQSLLEFVKKENSKKITYQTIQKIMDVYFSNGKDYRFLRVLPRITKTFSGNVLFLVTEKWNPEITQYEGLSPLFSVWVWKPGKRPAKLFLDKLYSKQYVFKTKQDAQSFFRSVKSEYWKSHDAKVRVCVMTHT